MYTGIICAKKLWVLTWQDLFFENSQGREKHFFNYTAIILYTKLSERFSLLCGGKRSQQTAPASQNKNKAWCPCFLLSPPSGEKTKHKKQAVVRVRRK